MTDRDLTAVLDRAVDALSPRDPDPVAAVIRRVRARRRRIIANSCVAVLVVAGAGVAGALATGHGTLRTGPPASDESGPVRQVTPWTGATATLEGVRVPVPEGWQVVHPEPQGYQYATGQVIDPGPCTTKGADRTIYVVDAGESWWPCVAGTATYVIAYQPPIVYPSSRPPVLQRDPSGQPVWSGASPAGTPVQRRTADLQFVFDQVEVQTFGFEPADAAAYLATVSAASAGPAEALTLPTVVHESRLADFGASRDAETSGAAGSSKDLRERLLARLGDSADSLTCVPALGTISVADLTGSTQPDTPGAEGNLTFDRTGACDQAFDNRGGLVTLDGAALHELLSTLPYLPSHNQPLPTDQSTARPPR